MSSNPYIIKKKPRETPGIVILAGAGPGEADLITLRLKQRLEAADVIITDRLVNTEIIERHARVDAMVLQAGKQGYNSNSAAQDEISALIIKYALEGKSVLRLKGGDVAIFSNVLDELEALVEHDIPFEIIPGITAASGASAYAGIPLTARGYSQGVQFLTYNPNSFYSPETWKHLASAADTLVFYMAAKNLAGLAELLLRYSRHPHTPIAVIEQATTIHQQVHVATLKGCVAEFAGRNFSSPSLVIVGEVVKLHESFKWFDSKEAGSVFRDLT